MAAKILTVNNDSSFPFPARRRIFLNHANNEQIQQQQIQSVKKIMGFHQMFCHK